MNIPDIKRLTVLLILIIAGKLATAQQSASTDSIKKADKWVKSRSWAPDLKIKLHKSTNSVDFKRQFQGNKEMWDKVFKFLADSKLATLPPGKYPVDGENAYASITLGPPKKLEDAKWESHRKYIDLQYVIMGKVKLGVCPLADAKVTEPYNEKKDAAHYMANGKYYVATPKNFFLFFPEDVHRPDIYIRGFDTLKKLVIKIRYKE